jgi:hypothetical protein
MYAGLLGPNTMHAGGCWLLTIHMWAQQQLDLQKQQYVQSVLQVPAVLPVFKLSTLTQLMHCCGC